VSADQSAQGADYVLSEEFVQRLAHGLDVYTNGERRAARGPWAKDYFVEAIKFALRHEGASILPRYAPRSAGQDLDDGGVSKPSDLSDGPQC
jgi:hypothetical protein